MAQVAQLMDEQITYKRLVQKQQRAIQADSATLRATTPAAALGPNLNALVPKALALTQFLEAWRQNLARLGFEPVRQNSEYLVLFGCRAADSDSSAIVFQTQSAHARVLVDNLALAADRFQFDMRRRFDRNPLHSPGHLIAGAPDPVTVLFDK